MWYPATGSLFSASQCQVARNAGQPVPDWLEAYAKKLGKGKKGWSVDCLDKITAAA
jgi:hypothetical protein